MLVMPIAVPANGAGAIQTTQNSDNNVFIGRGTDDISLYIASPQWGRYQDVTIRVREVLPNAWHIAGGRRYGNAAGQHDTAPTGDCVAS